MEVVPVLRRIVVLRTDAGPVSRNRREDRFEAIDVDPGLQDELAHGPGCPADAPENHDPVAEADGDGVTGLKGLGRA